MLEELKNLKYHGTKDSLLFFICDVIGKNTISIQDAKIICAHAPGKRHLSVENLIKYCYALGWIQVESDSISVTSNLSSLLSDKEALNNELVTSTINQMFLWEAFDTSMFSYDTIKRCYSFKNELLPLSLSCVRNMLISQGFLFTLRNDKGTKFYIMHQYEVLLAKYCKKKHRLLSLEKLKRQIENNEIVGEKAELFVLKFEKNRIGHPLCENIRRISEIDVSAGYDIISFDSSRSRIPDRFIEVKAISSSGFFWSKKELEIAKLKGFSYYLYLVELSRIEEQGYVPEIIQNPAITIMESDYWLIEAQS